MIDVFISIPITKQIFYLKTFDIFRIFAQNIDFGYTLEPPHQGGPMSINNLCFGSKTRNTVYPPHPNFTIQNWFKGVYFSCTRSHDVDIMFILDNIHLEQMVLRICPAQHHLNKDNFLTANNFLENNISHRMGKPTICIVGENKGADHRKADQRLCFRYTDSTIPLLSKLKISSL